MRWPLQPLHPFQETQPQPLFGASVDGVCQLWFTAAKLSYRIPICDTSATALCGTPGNKSCLLYSVLFLKPCHVFVRQCWYTFPGTRSLMISRYKNFWVKHQSWPALAQHVFVAAVAQQSGFCLCGQRNGNSKGTLVYMRWRVCFLVWLSEVNGNTFQTFLILFGKCVAKWVGETSPLNATKTFALARTDGLPTAHLLTAYYRGLWQVLNQHSHAPVPDGEPLGES